MNPVLVSRCGSPARDSSWPDLLVAPLIQIFRSTDEFLSVEIIEEVGVTQALQRLSRSCWETVGADGSH